MNDVSLDPLVKPRRDTILLKTSLYNVSQEHPPHTPLHPSPRRSLSRALQCQYPMATSPFVSSPAVEACHSCEI